MQDNADESLELGHRTRDVKKFVSDASDGPTPLLFYSRTRAGIFAITTAVHDQGT